MRHHNRAEEIMITVQVIGAIVIAVFFGLILTLGSGSDDDEEIIVTSITNNMLMGEVSRSPTVIVQDITATEQTSNISPATDMPTATPTTPLSDTNTPTRILTQTPTSTSSFTPLPTMTFTVFPVTLTDTLTPSEVPCEPVKDWVAYNVQSGDTFNTLAVQFQTSIADLQLGNCLTTSDLQGGQTIYVPPQVETISSSFATSQGCDNPKIRIMSPVVGETVTDGWEIVGVADPPDFGFYRVQLRGNTTGHAYQTLLESKRRVGEGNRIGFLKFPSNDSNGAYWLRLQVYDSTGQDAGGCEICVSFGANSGNCGFSGEKPGITTVARSAPNTSVSESVPAGNTGNTGQYNLWSSLQGCSPTGAGDGFPAVIPLGGGYIVRQEVSAIHNGVDLSAPTNTPVLAAGAGSVVFAGWSDVGYGNTIVIAHGTTFTLYAHLNTIGVSCGQEVSVGQSIGGVGTTGRSSGPHLHFEVRDAGGVAQNPRDYLDFSQCIGQWCFNGGGDQAQAHRTPARNPS